MPIPSGSLNTTNYVPLLSYVLATGCQSCYDSTGAAYASWANSIGATAQSFQAPTGSMTNNYHVTGVGNGCVLVGFTGIAGFRQGLQMFCQSNCQANTNILGSGGVNTLVAGQYMTYIDTALRSAIATAAGGSTQIKVWVSGHSLGGSFAAAAFARALQVGMPNVTQIVLYTFGAPKTFDQTGVNWITSHNSNSYNLGCDGDPIVKWPVDTLSQVAQTLDSVGNVVATFRNQNNFRALPFSYELTSNGGVTQVAPFSSLSLSDQIDALRSILVNNDLPDQHRIVTYVNRLWASWRAAMRPSHSTTERDLAQSMGGVLLPSDPTPADLPGGSLPALISQLPLPTPPPGGSINVSPSVVAITGAPINHGMREGQRRLAVRVGDGRARRKVLRIIQDLKYLYHHDAQVSAGVRRGSVFLKNPAFWTPLVSSAFDAALFHLGIISKAR